MLTRTRRPKTESLAASGSTGLRPFQNEPPTDFARAENREAMRRALEVVRGQLGRRYPLLIGGKEVDTGARAHRLGESEPEPCVVVGQGRRSPGPTTRPRRWPRPARLSRAGPRRLLTTGLPS